MAIGCPTPPVALTDAASPLELATLLALLCRALALLEPEDSTLLAAALALESAEPALPVMLSVFVPLRTVDADERIELPAAPADDVMLFASFETDVREEAIALASDRAESPLPVLVMTDRMLFWAMTATGLRTKSVVENFILVAWSIAR